jgi:7-cyano-7-deazaguanine reductase
MTIWLRTALYRRTRQGRPRFAFPAIETWQNQFPGYEISIDDPELTSVCPKTGLPDFGLLTIRYMPRDRCLELKSLKEYLFSYRNLGIFQENIVNQVLEDVVKACDPVWAVVRGEFRPRGGIGTTVEARWPRPIACPPQPILFAPASAPPWGRCCCSSALNLLNYIDRYILPGEVSLIQREFHSTDQQMGALTTALFIFYMLAAPLTGWLGDRFPASRSSSPARSSGAWPLWAPPGSTSYWTLYIRHALVGVGEATFGIFAPAVLADFYPERDRNRILSIFYLAIPVGAALGYLAGGQSARSGAGARRSSSAPFPA